MVFVVCVCVQETQKAKHEETVRADMETLCTSLCLSVCLSVCLYVRRYVMLHLDHYCLHFCRYVLWRKSLSCTNSTSQRVGGVDVQQ